MSLDKTRRSSLWGAGLFAVLGLFEFFIARHAQINDTVILHKGSWYTPEVGYIVAACLFAMAAFALLSALRGIR
jgi:hypothetical protein